MVVRRSNPPSVLYTDLAAVVNILTDFLLALLPVPLIWRLQMPLQTRLTLVVILSLGMFAAIAGIIRQVSTSEFRRPEPWMHDSYAIWNFIELDMAIIAASLPALKPIFSRFFDVARSITRGTRMTAYANKSGGGYLKQDHQSDGGNFALSNVDTQRQTRISAHPKGRVDAWGFEQAQSSEESILPRAGPDGKNGGIMVTKRVQVE